MRRPNELETGLLTGLIAGLAGGVLLAASASAAEVLTTSGSLIGDSSAVNFIAVSIAGAVLGTGFGALVSRYRPAAGETVFWGVVYGTVWWYLGWLTLLPLFRGDGLTWGLEAAQIAFPLLVGQLMYGAGTGATLALLRWRPGRSGQVAVNAGALIRGALAGLAAGALLGAMLDSQGSLAPVAAMVDSESHMTARWITAGIGLAAGILFAVLYPGSGTGPGPGLVRGSVYGLLWWVVGALTLVPTFNGSGLGWSLSDVQRGIVNLPANLLFGVSVALFYGWLGSVWRILFSEVGSPGDEGVGTQGLRIAGRSLLAGLVGGGLFSLVMLETGFLSAVAELVGSTSPVAGFFVHLAIATVVGTSYGLLFNRQSYDLGSALGWGVSYGFFWWILGPLTLMPIFLGADPQWTVEAVSRVFPNLVGHLAYGAGLGITYHILEARYRPWWLPRSVLAATRADQRRQQVLTAAPALWTVLVLVGLTLPVLLGG